MQKNPFLISDLLTLTMCEKQLSLKGKVVCERETDTGFTVLSHEGTPIDIIE